MKEIISSIAESVKARLSNTLYGTFAISWLIFHWNFVFSVLFLDQEKIWEYSHLLKDDYLVQRFFNWADWYFYISWLAPFLLTWIVIWKLPKWILIKAYTKNEDYETEKAIIKIDHDRKVEHQKTRLEKESVKKVREVVKKVKEEEKARKIDPTLSWEEEFNTVFASPQTLDAIKNAVQVVYQTSGNFTTERVEVSSYQSYLSSSQLARLDASGIVKISKDGNREKVSFTDKGKFFVKEFQERGVI